MLEAIRPKSPKITKIKREGAALLLFSGEGILRIMPVSDSIVRVSATGREQFSDNPGVGVEKTAVSGFDGWKFSESEEDVEITTRQLTVAVSKDDSVVSFFDAGGELVASECRRGGRSSRILEPFTSYRTVIDDKAVISKVETPDGIKNVVEYATKIPDKELYHTTTFWEWQDDEVLYGLGQPDDGVLNLRGTKRYLHQANLKIAIPMLISSKGYGILFPTGSPAIFNDLPYEESCIYTEADEELNYYLIFGPKFDRIISGYRRLTGKAAILPVWMYGYVQSQERYETQDEIIGIAEEFDRRKVGVDVIVQDWFTWEEGLWGQKTYDKSRYPDPKGMTDRLHDMGLNYMISIWPVMQEDSGNYHEMQDAGFLLPASDTYDAFNEDARKLYWKQAYEGLYRYGVDAWWCDSCEPLTPEWTRKIRPLPEKMYADFLEQTKKTMPEELGNAYGLYHALGLYEGQRSASPDRRLANLTRNAYTGAQKYGIILWSGDIYASWKILKEQIAAGLSLCASGIPWWTLDIGGFFVKNGDTWFWSGDYDKMTDDLGYRELYVRWFWFGAFLPVFRAHGTDCRREMWMFGDEGDMFYDSLLEANRLRYRLMPYIYSCAGDVFLNDSTMMRLLAFDFADDPNVLGISDQYMFGPSIMVCPVTEPMYYERDSKPLEDTAKTRSVYLPAGCVWYDFWTDDFYEGGQYITADAPLERIPLFVREGSIIPMTETEITRASDYKKAGIEFRIYPGRDASFDLYEDDGETYAYETGAFTRRTITWNEREQSLDVDPPFEV